MDLAGVGEDSIEQVGEVGIGAGVAIEDDEPSSGQICQRFEVRLRQGSDELAVGEGERAGRLHRPVELHIGPGTGIGKGCERVLRVVQRPSRPVRFEPSVGAGPLYGVVYVRGPHASPLLKNLRGDGVYGVGPRITEDTADLGGEPHSEHGQRSEEDLRCHVEVGDVWISGHFTEAPPLTAPGRRVALPANGRQHTTSQRRKRRKPGRRRTGSPSTEEQQPVIHAPVIPRPTAVRAGIASTTLC